MSSPQGQPPRPRRRHRRVDAPPTNPAADQSPDTPEPTEAPDPSPGPGASSGRDRPTGKVRPRRNAQATPDARDAWIIQQRPPHWD